MSISWKIGVRIFLRGNLEIKYDKLYFIFNYKKYFILLLIIKVVDFFFQFGIWREKKMSRDSRPLTSIVTILGISSFLSYNSLYYNIVV